MRPEQSVVRHSIVELADGTALAVQESGRADAPALLLLQGQANSHTWWTRLRERFADTHRTITFDYRGTGGTRAAEDKWSTSLFADDAREVLDALGAPRAFVYGTSMGGGVAQMLAIQSPGHVERLVLACTSPGGAVAVERSQEVRRELSQPDPRERTRALLRLMYTPDWFGHGRRSQLLGDPTMTSRAQALHLRVSARHDAADRLGEVAVPTLVMHGSDDLMAPVVNAQLIAERIRGAELVTIAGGRHGFFDEFAGDVSSTVRRFLRGRAGDV